MVISMTSLRLFRRGVADRAVLLLVVEIVERDAFAHVAPFPTDRQPPNTFRQLLLPRHGLPP